MQLLRDGVMDLEFAAQLLKRGIQVPRVYAGEHEDENKAACREAEDQLAVEADRDKLRARLKAQLN